MAVVTETLDIPYTTTLPAAPYVFSTLPCPTTDASLTGLVQSDFVFAPQGTSIIGADEPVHTITCRYYLVVSSSTTPTSTLVISTTTPSSTTSPTPSTSISTSNPAIILPSTTTAATTTPATTMYTRTLSNSSSWTPSSPSLQSEAKSASNNSSGRISAGVAAGIGVGIAVFCLLLGAAVAWFVLSRRRRRENESDLSNDKALVTPMLHPGPPSKILSTPGGSSAGWPPVPGAKSELDLFLLDGTSDNEITSELTALGHLITDHVENNYHLHPIHQDPAVVKDSLSELGLDDWTQSQVANLSLDPRTRHVAIRSLLAHVIFSALDIRNTEGPSLLPPEVAAFVKSLPRGKSVEPGTPNAKALERWRRLSAFLLHETSQERSPLPLPASITPQIENLLNAVDGFLGYFVHDDNRARFDQKRNLDGVIRECATLGYLIFSHPCEWRYSFQVEARNDVVVLPGLERLSRREGETYDSPRVVAWPVAVAV
ncbi:hypothetical protein QBC44DRAFT_278375 [Cladorrhinum sp. PSN332]|nr:hypothetical protein QBC44DRAFT_278375 [Cladorrhinum sp. PSN332]